MKNNNYAVKNLKKGTSRREISFCITEKCNFSCSYCYLPKKKANKSMSFNIAKKALDYFLENRNIFTEPQVVIDFIGGEPLLEIDLIDKIVDYFKITSYEKKHDWAFNYKIRITTNGVLYDTEKVQYFVKKNINNLFPAISLDGNEEKHNNARKYLNGRGTYTDVLRNAKLMLKQFPHTSVKSTFGKGDLMLLKDSIIHLWGLGFTSNFFSNIVYEDVWEEGDDILFEIQLKELANYMIENKLTETHECSYFSESLGNPYNSEQLKRHWCNSGQAIIIDTDGNIFPCIRFLEMSYSNGHRPRIIGNVFTGINFDKLRPFRVLNLENCSSIKCIECPIASFCGLCTGQGWSESDLGTIYFRPTHICKMHKARVKANEYYWRKLSQTKGYNKAKNFYLNQIKSPQKVLNILLSSDSPSICCYQTDSKNKMQRLSKQRLEDIIVEAKKNFYFLNVIVPNKGFGEYNEVKLLDSIEFQITKKYNGEDRKYLLEEGYVFIFDIGQHIQDGFSCTNAILQTDHSNIDDLAKYSENMFLKGITRINLVIRDFEQSNKFQMEKYEMQLGKIINILFEFYKKKDRRFFNVITDRMFLNKMNNCNAGLDHITLAPDGKIYICPAFYYQSLSEYASDTFEIPDFIKKRLKIENSLICQNCDTYQCKRCVFNNLIKTNELNVPGEYQCSLSHIERRITMRFQKMLIDNKLVEFPKNRLIQDLEYYEPFSVAQIW